MNESVLHAYALGCLDGYNTGSENNIFDPEVEPKEHKAYKMGYDYGIFLYCEEIEHV